MRVYAYARYSTEHQNEESITDQFRRCREFAARRGWDIAEEFSDEGISGAAFGNRPAFQRLMQALQQDDVLLVVDTTRLSRSQDLAPLLTRLRFRGISVLGVLDGFDNDSHGARMHAGLSGIMSEEFRANIARRTHSALEIRAMSGRATGGKCFGFSASGEVVESEATIVREVFARAAAGEPLKRIASDLNVRGVPAPGANWARKKRRRDGRWLVSAVHSLLQNERYTGRVVWNRRAWVRDPDSGRRCPVERPESEWVVSAGPSIIDSATWERVRSLAAARTLHGGKRGGGPRYPLSGILVCGLCGAKLVATGKDGRWYYCSSHHHGGAAACSMSVGARRDIAEERLLAPIEDKLLSAAAKRHALTIMSRLSREDSRSEARPAELEDIERRIARLEAQVASGALERADVAEAIETFEERRRAIQAACRRGRAHGPSGGLKSLERAWDAAVAQFRSLLAGPVAQARVAIHSVIGQVICTPDENGLVGKLKLNPVPLYRAAGIVSWIGSGGRI